MFNDIIVLVIIVENIIVTSGGFNIINNYVSEENIEYFKKISFGKKVLIIANAAPIGSGNYVAREDVISPPLFLLSLKMK